jgi:hypothetical protein
MDHEHVILLMNVIAFLQMYKYQIVTCTSTKYLCDGIKSCERNVLTALPLSCLQVVEAFLRD